MLEGIKVYKKFSNSFKFTQKTTNAETIKIDIENTEKMGFGSRFLILSKDLEKLHFLKNEGSSNKIEISLFLKDILRVFLPDKTLKIMKSLGNNENNQDFFKSSSVFNTNTDENNQYHIFLIFDKKERLELIVNGLKATELLIKGLNGVMGNKRIKEKIKNKLTCFCVVSN